MNVSARFLFGFGLLATGALIAWGSVSGNLAAMLAVMFDRGQLTATPPKRSDPLNIGSVITKAATGAAESIPIVGPILKVVKAVS